MHDRDALFHQELQQGFRRVEGVEDAEVGLVRVRPLVGILIGCDVVLTRKGDEAVCVDQTGRDRLG